MTGLVEISKNIIWLCFPLFVVQYELSSFFPKDSHTSTRGRSIGSSTTSGWEWSKATPGLSCGILWAATVCPPTPTGTGAPHKKRNRLNMTTMMTLISCWSWRAAVERRKRWPLPSPVSWPCAWWCCFTPCSASRGRTRSATYCTARDPCRSGSEKLTFHSHC